MSCRSLIDLGVGLWEGVGILAGEELDAVADLDLLFGISLRRGLFMAFFTTVTLGFASGGVSSGSSTPGGGATLFLGPCAALRVGRVVAGVAGLGDGDGAG